MGPRSRRARATSAGTGPAVAVHPDQKRAASAWSALVVTGPLKWVFAFEHGRGYRR